MKTCNFCGKKRKYYGKTNDGKCLCVICLLFNDEDNKDKINAYMLKQYGNLDDNDEVCHNNEEGYPCNCSMGVLNNLGCQCGGR